MVEIADWLVRHSVESVTVATGVVLHVLTLVDHSARIKATQARLLDAETTAQELLIRLSYIEGHLSDLGIAALDDHGIVYDQSPDDSDEVDEQEDSDEEDSDEVDEEPAPGEGEAQGSA